MPKSIFTDHITKAEFERKQMEKHNVTDKAFAITVDVSEVNPAEVIYVGRDPKKALDVLIEFLQAEGFDISRKYEE